MRSWTAYKLWEAKSLAAAQSAKNWHGAAAHPLATGRFGEDAYGEAMGLPERPLIPYAGNWVGQDSGVDVVQERATVDVKTVGPDKWMAFKIRAHQQITADYVFLMYLHDTNLDGEMLVHPWGFVDTAVIKKIKPQDYYGKPYHILEATDEEVVRADFRRAKALFGPAISWGTEHAA